MAENPSIEEPGMQGGGDGFGKVEATGAIPGLEDSDPDPRTGEFLPAVLDRTVIAVPLLKQLREEAESRSRDPSLSPRLYSLIIDLNNEYRGRQDVRKRVVALVARAIKDQGAIQPQGIDRDKSELSDQYMFARLEGRVIQELVRLDNERRPKITAEHPSEITGHRAIHGIWPDFEVYPLLTKSNVTVKADEAW